MGDLTRSRKGQFHANFGCSSKNGSSKLNKEGQLEGSLQKLNFFNENFSKKTQDVIYWRLKVSK